MKVEILQNIKQNKSLCYDLLNYMRKCGAMLICWFKIPVYSWTCIFYCHEDTDSPILFVAVAEFLGPAIFRGS